MKNINVVQYIKSPLSPVLLKAGGKNPVGMVSLSTLGSRLPTVYLRTIEGGGRKLSGSHLSSCNIQSPYF
jgi:hypothetical protein